MNYPFKKICSCEHFKPCPGVIKAIDICNIPPPTPPPLPTPPPPTYGNFFQTGFITLINNQPMPWNGKGETSGITLDPDTVTIRVTQAGVYYVDYQVNVAYFSNTGLTAQTAIFVNEVQVNPIQTRYGTSNTENERAECSSYSGGTIISIPTDGRVQLRNVNQTFSTCDDGAFLAASINLIKLN
ncbi:BclA C-terminal domain-containing protein [Lysinibacillus xylanilyticus]|uniref:BclA C-terminal domain-containing protein n=1 Tax=Lysinibacillus xylanilyticus TaxID=582475 RepID=UPI0037FD539E